MDEEQEQEDAHALDLSWTWVATNHCSFNKGFGRLLLEAAPEVGPSAADTDASLTLPHYFSAPAVT